MIKDILVAERYARALFEIARSLNKDEQIEAELENFSHALKADPELERGLTNPYLNLDQKRKMIEGIYGKQKEDYYGVLQDFFAVLFKKNRFNLIHEIAGVFKRIADEAQGQATVEIRSAVPLAPQAESQIVSRLEKMAGSKITVKKAVDPTLIGGIVVRIKNKIIDGSVKHKIRTIQKQLIKVHG